MRQSIILLSGLAALSVAQNQTDTFEFFIPGGVGDIAPLAAIKSVNPPTTVVSISCPTMGPSNFTRCEFGSGLDYTVISNSIHKGTMSDPEYVVTFSCEDNIKEQQVTCGMSARFSHPDSVMTTDVVYAMTEFPRINATITAGAEKLQAVETGVQGGASPTTSGGVRGTAAAGSQATATNPSATSGLPQSTGAAYRFGVEGSAFLVLAGAAALNAL